jgi:hypothetical protein
MRQKVSPDGHRLLVCRVVQVTFSSSSHHQPHNIGMQLGDGGEKKF